MAAAVHKTGTHKNRKTDGYTAMPPTFSPPGDDAKTLRMNGYTSCIIVELIRTPMDKKLQQNIDSYLMTWRVQQVDVVPVVLE